MKKELLTLHDGPFAYTGILGSPSECVLRAFQGEVLTYLVFIQPSVRGTSITNFAEELATRIVAQFHLKPDLCIFLHYYPPEFGGERFTRRHQLTFTWDGDEAKDPKWHALSEDDLSSILEAFDRREEPDQHIVQRLLSNRQMTKRRDRVKRWLLEQWRRVRDTGTIFPC